MSAFDLAGDHDSANLIDQARSNPLDLTQPAGFFTGTGTGAVTGIGRLLADTQRTTGLALGAVAGSFDMLTGDAINAQEKVFENIVAPADKLSRHLAPKPEEIGMAGQLLHGLIKIGGEAVAFGAPGVLAMETIGGTLDALDKGVDLQTAGKVGGVQGAAMTVGVMLPMTLGATGLGMNIVYGAGVNLSQGIFMRGATSEIYAKAGRDDLAAQFKALDMEAMAVDAILGVAFTGGGRYLQLRGEKAKADAVAAYKAKIADMLAPEQIDAALTKNEQIKLERSGMGLPADLASRDAHVANLTGAIDDLIEGRPVTVRNPDVEMIPDEAAAKVQADVEAELRAEVDPWNEPQAPRTFEQRIADKNIRAELLRMKGETGWAETGGKLLREVVDGDLDYGMGQGTGKVIGRTAWIPNAEWWPGRPKGLKEGEVHKAIDKAVAGETLTAKERKMVEYMVEVAEQRNKSAEWKPAGDELAESGLASHNELDVAMTARAAELNPDAVESLAMRFESDNIGFMRSIKELLDEHDRQTAASRQDGQRAPDTTTGQPDAGTSQQPASLRPDAVIPLDDADGTTTVAEAQGIFMRGATSEIYAKAGRDDLAAQFKALDMEAMAVEADDTVAARSLIEIHEPRDKAKLDALATDMEARGWVGRPVLVWDNGNGTYALTASHRIAAARRVDVDAPVVFVDSEKFIAQLEKEDTTFDSLIGSGDARVEDFLRRAGDQRAADLMANEIEASRNEQFAPVKVGADKTAPTVKDSLTPEPASLRPDAVIPLDDADGTTTVAEAQGIIADLETAAREQETGLRAAVACFLRAA